MEFALIRGGVVIPVKRGNCVLGTRIEWGELVVVNLFPLQFYARHDFTTKQGQFPFKNSSTTPRT